ncbi:unnamed protein product [Amoebophrya sp. A120]|nr:unnamed protein product [Amoebophrya sp. A120]|eukprot:GSA120T00003535001.1
MKATNSAEATSVSGERREDPPAAQVELHIDQRSDNSRDSSPRPSPDLLPIAIGQHDHISSNSAPAFLSLDEHNKSKMLNRPIMGRQAGGPPSKEQVQVDNQHEISSYTTNAGARQQLHHQVVPLLHEEHDVDHNQLQEVPHQSSVVASKGEASVQTDGPGGGVNLVVNSNPHKVVVDLLQDENFLHRRAMDEDAEDQSLTPPPRGRPSTYSSQSSLPMLVGNGFCSEQEEDAVSHSCPTTKSANIVGGGASDHDNHLPTSPTASEDITGTTTATKTAFSGRSNHGSSTSRRGRRDLVIAIVDFEANCVPNPGRDGPEWADPKHQIEGFVNEIIEFPTVILTCQEEPLVSTPLSSATSELISRAVISSGGELQITEQGSSLVGKSSSRPGSTAPAAGAPQELPVVATGGGDGALSTSKKSEEPAIPVVHHDEDKAVVETASLALDVTSKNKGIIKQEETSASLPVSSTASCSSGPTPASPSTSKDLPAAPSVDGAAPAAGEEEKSCNDIDTPSTATRAAAGTAVVTGPQHASVEVRLGELEHQNRREDAEPGSKPNSGFDSSSSVPTPTTKRSSFHPPRWAVTEEFNSFVRPVRFPILTPFCKSLTSITQDQVETADTFHPVWERWQQFMSKYPAEKVLFITCGDWDFRQCLPKQLAVADPERRSNTYWGKNTPIKRWCNLKQVFTALTGEIVTRDIPQMLEYFDLDFDGWEHRGIDDCKNIARVVQEIIRHFGVEALQVTSTGHYNYAAIARAYQEYWSREAAARRARARALEQGVEHAHRLYDTTSLYDSSTSRSGANTTTAAMSYNNGGGGTTSNINSSYNRAEDLYKTSSFWPSPGAREREREQYRRNNYNTRVGSYYHYYRYDYHDDWYYGHDSRAAKGAGHHGGVGTNGGGMMLNNSGRGGGGGPYNSNSNKNYHGSNYVNNTATGGGWETTSSSVTSSTNCTPNSTPNSRMQQHHSASPSLRRWGANGSTATGNMMNGGYNGAGGAHHAQYNNNLQHSFHQAGAPQHSNSGGPLGHHHISLNQLPHQHGATGTTGAPTSTTTSWTSTPSQHGANNSTGAINTSSRTVPLAPGGRSYLYPMQTGAGGGAPGQQTHGGNNNSWNNSTSSRGGYSYPAPISATYNSSPRCDQKHLAQQQGYINNHAYQQQQARIAARTLTDPVPGAAASRRAASGDHGGGSSQQQQTSRESSIASPPWQSKRPPRPPTQSWSKTLQPPTTHSAPNNPSSTGDPASNYASRQYQ